MDTAEALRKIDNWTRQSRVIKVAIISALGQIDDSGWGGALSMSESQLRVVYRRDSDEEHEIDTLIDLAGASVSGSTIWNATPEQQQKFGHVDETIGLSLPDGRTLLLMCTIPQDESAH